MLYAPSEFISYKSLSYLRRHQKRNRSLSIPFLHLIMVGVRGLEPPASWSQTKRATSCATPRYFRRQKRFYYIPDILSTHSAPNYLIYVYYTRHSSFYLSLSH